MRTYQKIVECFAVLYDPSNPERPPAFDVHVLTVIDMEDGSPPFADPRNARRVLNVAAAASEGLAIPEIAAALSADINEEAQREVARLRSEATLLKAALEEATEQRDFALSRIEELTKKA